VRAQKPKPPPTIMQAAKIIHRLIILETAVDRL